MEQRWYSPLSSCFAGPPSQCHPLPLPPRRLPEKARGNTAAATRLPCLRLSVLRQHASVSNRSHTWPEPTSFGTQQLMVLATGVLGHLNLSAAFLVQGVGLRGSPRTYVLPTTSIFLTIVARTSTKKKFRGQRWKHSWLNIVKMEDATKLCSRCSLGPSYLKGIRGHVERPCAGET